MSVQESAARGFQGLKARYVAVAAAAAALAVAAIAGAGGLQSGGSSGTAAVPAGEQPAARPGVPGERPLTFYLVASEAQAATVLRGVDDAERVRVAASDFETPEEVMVQVVADDAALARVMQAIIDAHAIRAELGLPQIKLVDLRQDVALLRP